jgi:phage gpG-like protein
MESTIRRIERVIDLEGNGTLNVIARILVTQTQRRIQDEKTGPDGEPWKPWSKQYAATRHGNHSLLVNEGNLMGSISSVVAGDTIVVAPNAPYAGPMQATRPYLGISEENEADLFDEIEDHLQGVLRSG